MSFHFNSTLETLTTKIDNEETIVKENIVLMVDSFSEVKKIGNSELKSPFDKNKKNYNKEFLDYSILFEEVIGVGFGYRKGFTIMLEAGTNKNEFISKCNTYDLSEIYIFVSEDDS